MSPLSLYELNRLVHESLSLTLPDTYWITTEISELRQTANGHCYLEVVEKEDQDSGTFKAKARANVWRDTWQKLHHKFQQATHQDLHAGIKVLIEVQVTFHEVYGYSLSVIDIDPSYTIGDISRRRQEILHQLEIDGTLTLNQELPLPRLLRNIAIISAEGAAGYGDFCRQIQQSGYNFHLHLFPALMQGATTAESIIAALNQIARQEDRWDCVAIIRGGGATSDLDGFENYDLASNVAQFPLPIFTGIGHERDNTVIDLVAHTRCKTPTAVAVFLIRRMQDEEQTLLTHRQTLREKIQQNLTNRRQSLELLTHRYSLAAQNYTTREQQQLQRRIARLHLALDRHVRQAENALQALHQRSHHSIEQNLAHQLQRLDSARRTLRMADPQHLLRLGYSITYGPDGRVLRSAAGLPSGTELCTRLAEGEVHSTLISSP